MVLLWLRYKVIQCELNKEKIWFPSSQEQDDITKFKKEGENEASTQGNMINKVQFYIENHLLYRCWLWSRHAWVSKEMPHLLWNVESESGLK